MSGQRLRILLIEDDEDDYVLVRGLLYEVKARSYQLDWKSTYEDALQGTEHDQYDACLLDYRLGERDGIQFLHEMSARDSKLPIILLTGQGNYEVDMQAMQSGASDYLVKDQITGPLLERSIRYAIERRRSEDRLRQSEERYRRIVEKRYHRLVQNVPILLFRLLNDFSLHFINQACLPILGYTPEDAMETPGWFLERVCSEDRARIKKLLESAFDANGRSFTTECRFWNRKGHAVHALLKCICCTECMAEGEPELLFLPFDKGGETIGLPLCYRLLRKMGGLLSFAQEPGHVIFTVSVPKTRNNHGRTMNEEGNDTDDTMGP